MHKLWMKFIHALLRSAQKPQIKAYFLENDKVCVGSYVKEKEIKEFVQFKYVHPIGIIGPLAVLS